MKGKSQVYLIISIAAMCFGFMGAFYFAIQEILPGIITSIVAIGIGAILLNHWSAISYIWICDHCKLEKELNDRENFIYQNIGVLKKSFECDQCNKKTTFVGEIKID